MGGLGSGGARLGAGRPRDPVSEHLRRGTYRPDRHRRRRGLVVPPLQHLGAPPAWLPEHGRELWSRLGPRLVARRVLTEFDLPAFAAVCAWWGTFRAAKTPEERKVASQEFMRWAKVFGLTPADRLRLHPDEDGDDGDAADDDFLRPEQ
jgi:phage terminase small subunit